MKDQQLTPAADLREGDTVSLLLTSWVAAEAQYGGMNRGELEEKIFCCRIPTLRN